MVTMADLVERYLEMKQLRDLDALTMRDIRSPLERLATEWDRTRRHPKGLDAEFLVGFFAKLKAGKVGGFGRAVENSTFNNYVAKIRSFIQYLNQRRIIDDPFVLDACQPAKMKERRPFLRLKPAEMELVIDMTEKPWDRWVMAFSYLTGGRITELRSRRVGDFNWAERTVEWQRAKARRKVHDTLPASQRLVDEYLRWMEHYQAKGGVTEDSFLIPRRALSGGTMYVPDQAASAQAIGRVIKKYMGEVGGLTADELHGQANHMTRRAGGHSLFWHLVTVEKMSFAEAADITRSWMGHEDVKTTMLYIGVDLERLRRDEVLERVELLGPMDQPDANVVALRPGR